MFLHVDMDAFFVSCEIATNPKIRHKPVVVSAGYKKRGVVASASYKARKYGIKSGMPLYMAKTLVPGLYVIPANIHKYASISEDIMKTLKKFTPNLEVFSIDEAYLDISYYKNNPVILAEKIKQEIKSLYKLPLSIGIGPSRIVAKAVCKKAKPDGIGIVYPENVMEFMGSLKVEEIPGIGEKSATVLKQHGIHRGVDLQKVEQDFLQKLFGIRGTWFKLLALGKDTGYFLPASSNTIKSIGHSETLPFFTTDITILKNYLLYLSLKVSQRAYRLNRMGNGIALQIKFSDFSHNTTQKKISGYLYRYDDIYKVACQILEGIHIKKPVRHLGITLYNLVPLNSQGTLFDTKSTSDILHKIYEKYGDFSIIPLSLLNINTSPKSIPPKIH